MSILKNATFWIILIFIVLGFFGYTYFFKPGTDTPLITSTGANVEDLEGGQEIARLLSSLSTIRLESTLFENRDFQTLQDFSIPIEDEPQGRSNPFAPFGIEAVAPTAATTTPLQTTPAPAPTTTTTSGTGSVLPTTPIDPL